MFVADLFDTSVVQQDHSSQIFMQFVRNNLSKTNVCQALTVACLHLQEDLQRHCVDFVRSVLSSMPQDPAFHEDLYQLDRESFMHCIEPSLCAMVRCCSLQLLPGLATWMSQGVTPVVLHACLGVDK